jgi:hypothetical protein
LLNALCTISDFFDWHDLDFSQSESLVFMMNGVQMETVRDAFLDGYNKSSLTQMLRFRLNKDLTDIVADGALKNMVFDLIDLADQEGWDAALIREAYRFNSGNEAMLQIYEKYGMAPKIDLTKAGESVAGDAIQTSSGLQRLIQKENPTLEINQWRSRLTEVESRVCRIDIDGNAEGTGFLVGSSVVLTNYHVVEKILSGKKHAASVSCLFDYKVLSNGSLNHGERFSLATDQSILLHSPYSAGEKAGTPDAILPTVDELDFALLKLDRAAGNEPTHAPRGFEILPNSASVYTENQGLIIAQHPAGAPMKLAIDTQSFLSVNANQTRVRYRTNTVGGSSGSPVFDMFWNLCALHHYGDPNWNDPLYNQGVAPLNRIREKIELAGFLPLLE